MRDKFWLRNHNPNGPRVSGYGRVCLVVSWHWAYEKFLQRQKEVNGSENKG
jgi:hypothetical protein